LISVTPASGVETLVPVSYIITSKPALVVAPASVVFTAANNQTVPPPQTVLATSSSRNFAYTAAVKVSTPPQGTWLQVTPTTGQTPATLVLSVNPAGLTEGVYNGAVELTPMEPGLSPNTIPVTLVVGCGQGGCETQPKIDVVVNSASFQPGGAPGALLSIFGSDLADGTYQSQQYPLPTKLGRTTVTANGQLVPLLYASPTLINFQMPSSAPPLVEIVVHNGAEISQRTLRASSGYVMQLAPVDPGLFINGDRAAALNGDLTVHTPATPIPAGGFVILYITGQGSVTPPVPDGTGAPSSPLSIIDAAVRVTIGGLDAKVDFKGLAPTLAGTGQINAAVPAGLTPGNHPVFVTVGGLPSNTGLITVK
jgi:adhesin/invasin